MDDRYRSRKFGLAVFFTLTSTTALFTDYLEGGEYLAAMGLVLGLYGMANVMQSKNE